MFYMPELIFSGTESVGSRFHVARPDSFSTVPRASCPVFMFCASGIVFGVTRASCLVYMFCAPGNIFGGTEGVMFCFHVLRSRTHFRRYRGRRVPYSCFTFPNLFSMVPRASSPFFMFCAPGIIFGGTGASTPIFLFCAAVLIFDSTEGVRSRFQVLRARTRFRRYRGRRVPYSCFALPDSFSAVPRASIPVFMFCAPRLIFDGTEGVSSLFHVLRS
jgi:hypothetical protein